MNRLVAEWLWRVATLFALAVIGWELHGFREDMMQPVDDQSTAAAAPDDVQSSLDDLRDDVATLNAKVDAMMMAMMQLKR
jgi:hypothetical protein